MNEGRLSDMKIFNVSAHPSVYTEVRMPLLRRLRAVFGSVVLYCPDHEPAHIELLRREGFEVMVGPVSARPGPALLFEIAGLCSVLRRERPDLLIAHQTMGALVGLTAARLSGVPARVYSTGGLKYTPDRKDFFNTVIKHVERILIRWSDRVFVVNREDEEMLSRIPAVRDKVFYCGPRGGCGIDTALFNPGARLGSRDEARLELGLLKTDTAVGYVGRLVWEKGFRELIDSVEFLEALPHGGKMVYVVVGDGPDADDIKRYAKDRGCSGRFKFAGYRFDARRYMSALDAFVLPSYREGLPVALLEAMALGLPCIAADIRGCRELISDGDTGLLVPARDARRLAGAVSRVASDEGYARRLGEQAAETVSKTYSEDALLDKAVAEISDLALRGAG